MSLLGSLFLAAELGAVGLIGSVGIRDYLQRPIPRVEFKEDGIQLHNDGKKDLWPFHAHGTISNGSPHKKILFTVPCVRPGTCEDWAEVHNLPGQFSNITFSYNVYVLGQAFERCKTFNREDSQIRAKL